jgi:hypothetical protein
MGAGGTFEHRRTELALLQDRDRDSFSDDEVYESFVAAAEPGGAYHEYISHAQLAAVWGNTLFLHGGMRDRGCGYILPDCLQWKVRCIFGVGFLWLSR